DAGGIAHIVDRVALWLKGDAMELSGQKASVPLPRRDRLSTAAALRRHDDETGQVVALAAEAIRHPRAHARPARDGGAGVHEGVGRIVVDRLTLHRPVDTKVIRNRADVRQDVADLQA